jgi:hypothetical protein
MIAHCRPLIEVSTMIFDFEQRFPLALPSTVWHPPEPDKLVGFCSEKPNRIPNCRGGRMQNIYARWPIPRR